MHHLHKGDRVRLTPKAARAFLVQKGPNYVDWKTRIGTVVTINDHDAAVKWDDRSSLDRWPLGALEIRDG